MRSLPLQLLSAVLAAVAYRQLGSLEPTVSVSEEVAEWFFAPNDNAPLAVVAMSLWLLFRRRGRLLALSQQPGPIWLTAALLVAGVGLLCWSTYAAAPGLLAISLAFNVLGIGCLFAGVPAVRVLLLPACFLLFAVPVPPPLLNAIVFKLQIWSANYAGWMLFFLGVPALVVGDVISQTQETFRVIETCSGFRSTITLMMFAVLLADLNGRRGPRMLLLVLFAPLIAFFLNGLRILGLILNPYATIASVHELQGALILLGGIGCLYAVDGITSRWIPKSARRSAAVGGGQLEPPRAAPVEPKRPDWRPTYAAGLLAVCVAFSIWLPQWRTASSMVPNPLMQGLLGELDGWSSSPRELDRVFLGSVGIKTYVSRRFEHGSEAVDLMLALDDHPDAQFRSVMSPKLGLPGSGWAVVDAWDLRLAPDWPSARARLLRSGKNLRLSYHWYQGSGGFWRETMRSLLALNVGPFPRGAELMAVRLSTRVEDDSPEALAAADALLSRFFRIARPEFVSIQQTLTRSTASPISHIGKSVSASALGETGQTLLNQPLEP